MDTQGDAFFAVFPKASEAVNAVVIKQRAITEGIWPQDVQVRVRIGLHTGELWLVEEGYMGMDVHRAARVGHVGHGGQVLFSETTTALVQDELPEGVARLELGRRRLKDMQRPSQPRAGGYGPCNDPAAPVDRESPGDQPPIVSLSIWQRISLLRSLE